MKHALCLHILSVKEPTMHSGNCTIYCLRLALRCFILMTGVLIPEICHFKITSSENLTHSVLSAKISLYALASNVSLVKPFVSLNPKLCMILSSDLSSISLSFLIFIFCSNNSFDPLPAQHIMQLHIHQRCNEIIRCAARSAVHEQCGFGCCQVVKHEFIV